MESRETPMTDERRREGVRYFSEQLRKLGLTGATGSNSQERPEVQIVLEEGAPPRLETVKREP